MQPQRKGLDLDLNTFKQAERKQAGGMTLQAWLQFYVTSSRCISLSGWSDLVAGVLRSQSCVTAKIRMLCGQRACSILQSFAVVCIGAAADSRTNRACVGPVSKKRPPTYCRSLGDGAETGRHQSSRRSMETGPRIGRDLTLLTAWSGTMPPISRSLPETYACQSLASLGWNC